ncbi:hypothetical protein ACJX0J_020398 [Zea mays]
MFSLTGFNHHPVFSKSSISREGFSLALDGVWNAQAATLDSKTVSWRRKNRGISFSRGIMHSLILRDQACPLRFFMLNMPWRKHRKMTLNNAVSLTKTCILFPFI